MSQDDDLFGDEELEKGSIDNYLFKPEEIRLGLPNYVSLNFNDINLLNIGTSDLCDFLSSKVNDKLGLRSRDTRERLFKLIKEVK
jgi:hypothetical protein